MDTPQPHADHETDTTPSSGARRRGRRALVAAAMTGALVVAGIGVAWAQTDSPTTTTSPPSSDAAPVPRPGHFGKHFGVGEPGGFGHVGHFGQGRAIHGEFVVPNGTGFRTMATQTGEVTSVDKGSITVKSADGFSKKYAVDENTLVNAGRDGIDSVKKGETVHVSALVEGGTARAMRIADGTTLGAIGRHWAPAAPSGTESSPST
jgi:hypothetical protein